MLLEVKRADPEDEPVSPDDGLCDKPLEEMLLEWPTVAVLVDADEGVAVNTIVEVHSIL